MAVRSSRHATTASPPTRHSPALNPQGDNALLIRQFTLLSLVSAALPCWRFSLPVTAVRKFTLSSNLRFHRIEAALPFDCSSISIWWREITSLGGAGLRLPLSPRIWILRRVSGREFASANILGIALSCRAPRGRLLWWSVKNGEIKARTRSKRHGRFLFPSFCADLGRTCVKGLTATTNYSKRSKHKNVQKNAYLLWTFSRKSPLPSHKTTLKQQINGYKRWKTRERINTSCFGDFF